MSDCCSTNAGADFTPTAMACPGDGACSKQVDILTVKSLVRKLPLGMPNSQYYFCDSPGCAVVYFPFEAKGPVFRREKLLVRVGAKEKKGSIPICYCFGFALQDIWDEIRTTGKSTVAERIASAIKADRCACEVRNPSGKCCLGEIIKAAEVARTSLKTETS